MQYTVDPDLDAQFAPRGHGTVTTPTPYVLQFMKDRTALPSTERLAHLGVTVRSVQIVHVVRAAAAVALEPLLRLGV